MKKIIKKLNKIAGTPEFKSARLQISDFPMFNNSFKFIK
jgi:hypothetical protein